MRNNGEAPMRVFLWIALVGGCLGAVLGFFHYLSLQPDLYRQPAIVIVPQLIQAVLVGGFGVIAAAIGAAGLALLEAADRHQATLDRIARQTEPPPSPLPQAQRPPPATPAPPSARGAVDPQAPTTPRGTPPFGMKACPSCGGSNWLDATKCSTCGTTFAMATQKPPPPARKVCAVCGEDSAAHVDRCPKCNTFFPLAPLPGDPRKS